MKPRQRDMIDRVCHFTHPDTGEVIEGIYRRGRTIECTVGMKMSDRSGGGRTYDIQTQTWTIPRNITIHIGPKPAGTKDAQK